MDLYQLRSTLWTMLAISISLVILLSTLTVMAVSHDSWFSVPCLLMALGWGWAVGWLWGVKEDLDEMIKKEEKPDGYR